MINSSFGAMTTARLAMVASQKALQVAGQNIANINTAGYTRQCLDQISLNVGSGSNRYSSQFNVGVGNGVLVTGVSQIRDPYLDRRFRTEMGRVGEMDEKYSALEDLQRILDEVGKVDNGGGIHNQMADLIDQLEKLAGEIGNKEFDSIVKSSADVLTKLFNQYDSQMETLRKNMEKDLKDTDIPEINNILESIRKLNVSIKDSQLGGNPALELQDQRNALIDELSSRFSIEVKYKPNQITPDTTIDELSISLVNYDGNEDFLLINDDKCAQFEVEKAGDQWELRMTAAPNDKKSTENISYGNTSNLSKDNVTSINELVGKIRSLKDAMANGDNRQETQDKLTKYLKQIEKFPAIEIRNQSDLQNFEIYLKNTANPANPLTLIKGDETGVISNAAIDKNGNLNFDFSVNTTTEGNYTFDATSGLTKDDIKIINTAVTQIKQLNEAVKNGDHTAETLKQRQDLVNVLKAYNTLTVQPETAGAGDTVQITMKNPQDSTKPIHLLVGNDTGVLSDPSVANDGKLTVHATVTTSVATNGMTYNNFDNRTLDQINTLSQQIYDLNQSIAKIEAGGGNASAERTQLQNSVQSLLDIKNSNSNYNGLQISATGTVPATVSFIDSSGTTHPLVDGNVVGNLRKLDVNPDGSFNIRYNTTTYDQNYEVNDAYPLLETGSLKTQLDMLNCSGEFDEAPNSPKGLGYYTKSLDVLANTFANAMNKANNPNPDPNNMTANDLFTTNDGSNTITAGNICLVDNWPGITASTSAENPKQDNTNVLLMVSMLKGDTAFKISNKSVQKGNHTYSPAPLTLDDIETINTTVSYIQDLNTKISNGDTSAETIKLRDNLAAKINGLGSVGGVGGITISTSPSTDPAVPGRMTIEIADPVLPGQPLELLDGNNTISVLENASISTGDLNFDLVQKTPIPGKVDLFNGSFQECFVNIGSVLSLEIKSTTEMLTNYTTVASELSDARDNVSGVSLDEEGMNLLQFQKSFTAAARLMTTLDEQLDVIINKMGIVGR